MLTNVGVERWDELHRDKRHALKHPSEHVVRFLSGLVPGKAIDIGCGNGRHLNLLRRMGFDAYGVERSENALEWNRENSLSVIVADMTNLKFRGSLFDVALSYGVFYYGTKEDHRAAIAEMHRVLRPGGRALVCIRRHDDWREQFTYYGTFHCNGEPEDGMPMHFLTEYEVRTFYAAFTNLDLNWSKTTRGPRCDSDWLISLQK